jgi:hypothetical protein
VGVAVGVEPALHRLLTEETSIVLPLVVLVLDHGGREAEQAGSTSTQLPSSPLGFITGRGALCAEAAPLSACSTRSNSH